jgi:nicotinate-nucleotide adenylyltransferase
MTGRPLVGVLGGTFDPVHEGHLAVARSAEVALDLDVIRFIPASHPPHRADSPGASGYHRAEMLRLALAGAGSHRALWEVSDLELGREGPSYTIDTLRALHAEGLSPLQIHFLIGADAFAEIATWRQYPVLLDAANFAVVARHGVTLESLRLRLPALASRMSGVHQHANATTPRVILVEADTPVVSSTDIRRRAARGEPLGPHVPDAVRAYIAQHSLYRHPSDRRPVKDATDSSTPGR